MRYIYFTIGLTSLILAVFGVFLPLLPTTPFLLLSAFCFARSSDKFHTWLIEHKYFGKNIRDWQENGSISPKAKTAAMATILATFILSIVLQVPVRVLAIQGIVLCMVSTFILTRPNS